MSDHDEDLYKNLPPEWRDRAKNFVSFIEMMQPVIRVVIEKIADTLEKWQPTIQLIADAIEKWDKNRRDNVIFMVQNGWFPSWKTLLRGERDIAKLDVYMMDRLKVSLPEIKQRLIAIYPHRSRFIEKAFNLHENGDFIASVPLFLIQADGICKEKISPYFSRDPETKIGKLPKVILEKFYARELTLDWFNSHLIEPLKMSPQIQNSSTMYSEAHKLNGPNRHGILHGSAGHLDYDTEINSYKAISFLAFVSTLLNKELQDLWMQNFENKNISSQTYIIENKEITAHT